MNISYLLIILSVFNAHHNAIFTIFLLVFLQKYNNISVRIFFGHTKILGSPLYVSVFTTNDM